MIANQENEKRKSKPFAKFLKGFAVLLLVMSLCYFSYNYFLPVLFTIPINPVWWLNGVTTPESMEDALLSRIPIGTSRETVETFIDENLQPSRIHANSDTEIRLTIQAEAIICFHDVWAIKFALENDELVDVTVNKDEMSCI